MPEMNQPLSDTCAAQASQRIHATITRLRQLTQQNVQSGWRSHSPVDSAHPSLDAEQWCQWEPVTVNDRGHIAWSRGQKVLWLGQVLTIPAALRDYPLDGFLLRLSLTWWAEDAQIFVDGELVQAGDLFDCSARIVLRSQVVPGDQIWVAMRLVSPGHDAGALVRSQLLYENPSFTPLNPPTFSEQASPKPRGETPILPLAKGEPEGVVPEPGFVADELAVLCRYLQTFEPEQLPILAEAVAAIPWEEVSNRAEFDRAIAHLRQQLLPFSDWIKQRTINLLGHAHLDLAWLWPIPETWEVAERTFASVLSLQQDYPHLIFGHSTPRLYEWIEQHRPDLFARIQAQIQAGNWEVIAGLWVEPELNVVDGESIVRQVLYGQRYCLEKFGHLSRVAWLPDTFGFCWQLPQILHQGGIDYFVTQKLRWNDTTEFPYDLFAWRSPDHTTITSLMSAPIGTGIDPVQMAEYACNWEQSTGLQTCLWLPGVGDHGGGPSRDMLELVARWKRSPFFPNLEFSPATDFLDELQKAELKAEGRRQKAEVKAEGRRQKAEVKAEGRRQKAELKAEGRRQKAEVKAETQNSPTPPLPAWNSELYLQLHRGCYTAHADQKYWNRRCEALLYEAELWSSLATVLTKADYPKIEIETAWKMVLFNQFHDILPGSSIAAVYEQVNPQWQQAAATSESLIQAALTALIRQVYPPEPPTPASIPVVIFNSLNWDRTEAIAIPTLLEHRTITHWQIQTTDGQALPYQLQPNDDSQPQLLIQASTIPGVGYQLFWLTPLVEGTQNSPTPPLPHSPTLQNPTLKVTINPTTGEIEQIYDKLQGRSLLSAPGNQLLAFQDSGEYWDAWNIAPNYLEHPLPPFKLVAIEWIVDGPVEQRLRVVRQLGASTFSQDYVLEKHSPLLRIETVVEWCDRHTVVKATFPLALSADYVTYDMPAGAIQRPTRPTTPEERAQWEVPGLGWADLTETTVSGESYGLSILSDYKHGYSATPSELRLTLLRGPMWPEVDADRGTHRFCYAIYPHAGDWTVARTVHHSYALRHPLRAVFGVNDKVGDRPSKVSDRPSNAALPSRTTLLHLASPHFILRALKLAEADPHGWTLRGYECHGEGGTVHWAGFFGDQPGVHPPSPTTILETELSQSHANDRAVGDSVTKISANSHALAISPWGIHTWRIADTPTV
ncbi:MAG: alpha-mannosidase [Cyanothece sp. SIO2G6]|nr:alpha-mannosidase [Cyanothece sp. SIO2G6]